MKYSYYWLKWYVPDAPPIEKLEEIITYHLFEVEGVEKLPDGDAVFDIKILPNRAHDLLSHQGLAREVASLLGIHFNDPTPKYKIPEAHRATLGIKVETEKCRRYMGRIVKNVQVRPSVDWVVQHLESIGQRSINNIVDAANIVMYDCGQPIHCFDLDKVHGSIIVREAKDGEEMTTLDNKLVKFKPGDMVISDEKNILAIAGVKGGKIAEVDVDTKNIIIEVANFDPNSVRKTAKRAGIFTDAVKRFENDLSPTLCDFAMLEMSALIVEYGMGEFEEIVDVYNGISVERKLSFHVLKISKILGMDVSSAQIIEILGRYNISYEHKGDEFIIEVPSMRLDLEIEEDVAEEIGRVIGYDKLELNMPKIEFIPKVNETHAKISEARNKLLDDGYSEVMTYTFTNKGEVGVLESASDKKFLRTNLADGLKESLKLNKLNGPLLGLKEIKIFEIGTVFKKSGEEINIAWNEKDQVKEVALEEFASPDTFPQSLGSETSSATPSKKHPASAFYLWSLFPFIARDVAVWVGEGTESREVLKVIKENAGDLMVREPELFDEFKKPASTAGGDAKVSYAFRIIFQSYERTLTDIEINEIMLKISNKIKAQNGWQVR